MSAVLVGHVVVQVTLLPPFFRTELEANDQVRLKIKEMHPYRGEKPIACVYYQT